MQSADIPRTALFFSTNRSNCVIRYASMFDKY